MNRLLKPLLLLPVLIACTMAIAQNRQAGITEPGENSQLLKSRSLPRTSPLIQTTWGEGCLYNANCPADTASHATCLHVPAGSGAVAMAQLMKFYNFPLHGTGEHGYPHPKYGLQYANFAAATYLWSQMPAALGTSNSDVAIAIYHAAVAQDMNFGASFSTSAEDMLDTALVKYFGYPKSAGWKSMSAYTSQEWINMLKSEINAGHPLICSGRNYNNTAQRFFIIDGYDAGDLFHVNWGDAGDGDGYAGLNALVHDTINFSYNVRALFGLAPSPPSPTSYIMDFENVGDFSLTFNDWSVRDLDLQDTYGIENHSFPHQNEPMAFLCFNPGQVLPSMASDPAIQAHGGQRFGACFSSNPPSNNDWFISPQVTMGQNGTFSFWIKSYNSTWGVDSYHVAVSTTDNNPASFTVISGNEPLLCTTAWTRKVFNLNAYNQQKIYVAIQCVSSDNFLMMIDDLEIKPQATSLLTADFIADKTNVHVGDTVVFTDQSSGAPTAWEWSFPGGIPSSSNAQNPGQVRYNTAGTYDVRLKISNGTSVDSIVKSGYIRVSGYPSSMSLDFESLADFTTNFNPWTTEDVGGGNTYTITGTTFTNQGLPMAFICFAPTKTNPPMTNMAAHSGLRMGACFSSAPPFNPNNKWLISPPVSLGDNGKVELWVRTYNNFYGDEKYFVSVSNKSNKPVDFVPLTAFAEAAPLDWTLVSYPLDKYAFQDVYIGIQCVTNDGFILLIDDLSITSSLGTEEKEMTTFTVFPNPATDYFEVKQHGNIMNFRHARLVNAMGSTVREWAIPENADRMQYHIAGIPSGVYFLQLSDGQRLSTQKLTIISNH